MEERGGKRIRHRSYPTQQDGHLAPDPWGFLYEEKCPLCHLEKGWKGGEGRQVRAQGETHSKARGRRRRVRAGRPCALQVSAEEPARLRARATQGLRAGVGSNEGAAATRSAPFGWGWFAT